MTSAAKLHPVGVLFLQVCSNLSDIRTNLLKKYSHGVYLGHYCTLAVTFDISIKEAYLETILFIESSLERIHEAFTNIQQKNMFNDCRFSE